MKIQRGIKAAITPMVLDGANNADLVAAFPHFKPKSVAVVAAGIRAENGCGRKRAEKLITGAGVHLPDRLHKALEVQAFGGGGAARHDSVAQFVIHLLSIIVRDDLFAAILDEGKP